MPPGGAFVQVLFDNDATAGGGRAHGATARADRDGRPGVYQLLGEPLGRHQAQALVL